MSLIYWVGKKGEFATNYIKKQFKNLNVILHNGPFKNNILERIIRIGRKVSSII